MTLRKKVEVEGIPIVWSTNLSDDEIREFYPRLKNDPYFAAHIEDKIQITGGMSLSFRTFSKEIEFRNGRCACYGFNNCLFLIYRTTKEWEFLEAREREIQELRNEQTLEHKVETLIFRNEDDHLSESVAEHLKDKNYKEVIRLLHLRVELRKENRKIKTYLVARGNLFREAITIFCNFPETDDGIRFILERFHWAWALYDFAKNYWSSNSRDRTDLMLEIDKIFRAVVENFPTDARIHKMICLFLEREGALDRAIQYCKIGASRCLKDGTVNGFSGRLKRLEKKNERQRNKITRTLSQSDVS